MNCTETLEMFTISYCNLKNIPEDMKKCLLKEKPATGKLRFINYSELTDWAPWNKINHTNLSVLIDKIEAMINKGDAINVLPLVKSICSNKIKKQSKPEKSFTICGELVKETTFLGYGHFRWNGKAQILTNDELDLLRNYFNL